MIIKPTWLGEPLYPGGFPLRPNAVSAAEKTIEQIYMDQIDTPLTEDELETVKSYIVYYLNAPIWEIPEDEMLSEEELMKMSVDDLLYFCLDLGLDPL